LVAHEKSHPRRPISFLKHCRLTKSLSAQA
jgi:hypothetical protein